MHGFGWRLAVLLIVPVTAAAVAEPASSRVIDSKVIADSNTSGVSPSPAATMICAAETLNDISATIGVQPSEVTTPTWTNHVYACEYRYPTGAIAVSVREFQNPPAGRQYLNNQAKRLGKRTQPFLAQGGYFLANGSIIVRKDADVLEVDVSAVPTNFGDPSLTLGPKEVATIVATAILKCWRQR